jgi:hypothetical protein
MRGLAILAATVFMTSCAVSSNTIPFSQATPVPADRVLAFGRPDAVHTAEVLIKRDTGLGAGSRVGAKVYVDGKLTAVLDKGDKVALYLRPGEVTLGVQPEDAIFAPSGALFETQATIKASDTNHFRIVGTGVGDGVNVMIQRTATE